MDVRQSPLDAVVVEGQIFVVHPEQMQDRRVQVVPGDNVLFGLETERIGGAERVRRAHSCTSEPCCEAEGVVIPAVGSRLEHRHAAELSAKDDQRRLEKAALSQVLLVAVDVDDPSSWTLKDRYEVGGYPTVDVAVRLVDGKSHEVDSSERSFKIAASIGMREALRAAGPVLLEPVMGVESVTPDEFVGSLQGDLNSRRGSITGFNPRSNVQAITADVPLATMFGYVNNLRSMTQGRATYTMQFSHYAEVPPEIASGIVFH